MDYFKPFNHLLSGFNPAETRIPDGKIWHVDEFRIGRELYKDIALQLKGEPQVELIKPHNLLHEAEKYILYKSTKSWKQKIEAMSVKYIVHLSTEGMTYWTLKQ